MSKATNTERFFPRKEAALSFAVVQSGRFLWPRAREAGLAMVAAIGKAIKGLVAGVGACLAVAAENVPFHQPERIVGYSRSACLEYFPLAHGTIYIAPPWVLLFLIFYVDIGMGLAFAKVAVNGVPSREARACNLEICGFSGTYITAVWPCAHPDRCVICLAFHHATVGLAHLCEGRPFITAHRRETKEHITR